MNHSNFLKRFSAWVVLFLIGFLPNQKALGEHWKVFGKTPNGTLQFIDRDSIVTISPGIKQVWQKVFHPLSDLNKHREKSVLDGEAYASYSNSMYLWEINCKARLAKLLYFADYSNTNQKIYSVDFNESLPEAIHPGSIPEGLHKALCPKTSPKGPALKKF